MRWTLFAIAVSIFTSGTSLAADANPPSLPGPWHPYPTGTDIDRPAGDPCTFPLLEHVVDDQEVGRTLAVDASGNPTIVEVKGDLVTSYTNAVTGKSVIRHVNGHAFLFFHPDNTQTWVIDGPFAGAVHAVTKNTFVPALEPGSYIWSGLTVLEAHADHTATVTWAGPLENLCKTVSDNP